MVNDKWWVSLSFWRGTMKNPVTNEIVVDRLDPSISQGDKLLVYRIRNTYNKSMEFSPKIVYQDDDYLFCRKPHGLSSTWGQKESFLDIIQKIGSDDDVRKQQISTFGREWEYGLLNRLDNVTAGLLYFARSYEAKANYIHLQQNWQIQKIYYAKVYGTPQAQIGWIEDPIFHHRTDSARMTIDPTKWRDMQSATTYREIVDWASKWEFAWLRIIISSWTRHQIRVHLASIGHPIVGDQLYMSKGLKKRYSEELRIKSWEPASSADRWKIELVSGGVTFN